LQAKGYKTYLKSIENFYELHVIFLVIFIDMCGKSALKINKNALFLIYNYYIYLRIACY